MRLRSRICLLIVFLGVAVLGTWRGNAFALLGPFQPWMESTNGLDLPGDIGGPMSIGEGYRWNVPIITYGFDKSFIDFFGTNGETAVESAIQVLNNLPPASQIAFTNYPFNSMEYNYTALAQGLIDLKSWTLPLLLEHMGLTTPSRYVFVLRQWNPVFIPPSPNEYSWEMDWPDWVYPDYISELNFDPQTLAASHYVNDTLYTGAVVTFGTQNAIETYAVDPNSESYTAVADGFVNGEPMGEFYNGLTRDDIGGLRYLLSTNNIAYETLLPGVHGVGTNACSFVDGAWRPGLDKITFVPQPTDSRSGKFRPMKYRYTDTYLTNGVWIHQELERIVRKPDFEFCVRDLGKNQPSPFLYDRTSATNWMNNAELNGNSDGGGPGVIRPPVKITFDKLGPQYSSYESPSSAGTDFEPQAWGSFDSSTNAPIIYPVPHIGTNQTTVRLWFWTPAENSQKSFTWKPSSVSGSQYALQTSTDLDNWTTICVVTNNGSVCTYVIDDPSGTGQFFRLKVINY